MIFQHTIDLVLSGRKSQTCRRAHEKSTTHLMPDNIARKLVAIEPSEWSDGVVSYPLSGPRWRWIVGNTYAICRGRGKKSEGRFRCTYLREVPNPTNVTAAFVHAEGLDSVEEYLRIWREMHGEFKGRCWAIGMELVTTEGMER